VVPCEISFLLVRARAQPVAKLFNLLVERLVFIHLTHEEPLGHRTFLRNALRGENVGLPALVLRRRKIPQLHETLRYQCFQHIMDATDTDTNAISHFTLRHLRVVLKYAQNTKVSALLKAASFAGHWFIWAYVRLPHKACSWPSVLISVRQLTG
jgi:hypothetical protein